MENNKNDWTLMRVRTGQHRRLKAAAAIRGLKIVDLVDSVLDMLDQQADRPTADPLGLRGEPQDSK